MTYVVVMGSGVMIYIPNFIRIDLGNQKRDSQTAWRSHKPTFIFAK
jgi:hypothetical protein